MHEIRYQPGTHKTSRDAASIAVYELYSGAGDTVTVTPNEGHRVTVRAIDGELECGVDVIVATGNGILISEMHLCGVKRPMVQTIVDAALRDVWTARKAAKAAR